MKTSVLSCLLTTIFACYSFHSQAQLTPHQAVPLMQKGINLGNTLEPPLEGGWNNPPAQEYYFDLYQQAGFNTVRIPVRWDQHTLTVSPYTITESWLQRVEDVLDWGLERGLFVVVNAHHDDWIKQNYTDPGMRARFDSIWSQIAVRFKDKSDRLLFEILNEPHGLTKEQNDDMHQRVLSIIRKTNPTRIVIFQGHNWGGSDELITAAIPDDDYIMGSFHSYDPYLFGLEGEGTWGTPYDYSVLQQKFTNVKTWSDNNNIPVFLGEFGSLRSCDYNSRMKHYRAYVDFAQQYGFIACAWDDGGDFRIMERAAKKWDEVKDILICTSDSSPRNLNLSIYTDTLVQLTWTNAKADYDSLFIQHRTPDGSYLRIATLKGDTTSFLHTNAAPELYHHYRVIAHYNNGEQYYTQPMRIFMPTYVPKVRGYFLGAPFTLPCIIEAEDFDTGGEGCSYHDVTVWNVGGSYRADEGVDIYSRTSGGYHIGNNYPGEWYEYTIDVAQTGPYKVDIHIASIETGGSFILQAGTTLSDTLYAPNTGSRLTTAPVSDTLTLEEGIQVLRLIIAADPTFNIDKLEFTSLSAPTHVLNQETDHLIAYRNGCGEIIVKTNSNEKILRLQLYSSNGLCMADRLNTEHTARLSTEKFPKGLYIIRALTDSGTRNVKIAL